MWRNYFSVLLLLVVLQRTAMSQLMFPLKEEVGHYKPIKINPISSTCGLDLKETLCDNRFQDNRFCSNISSIIECHQICPYGNAFVNLNENMKQLNLESMEPCQILKDYGRTLTTSKSTFSYFFDKFNNLCNTDTARSVWKSFGLQSVSEIFFQDPIINLVRKGFARTTFSKFNSGFTATFWIQQFTNNNGTLLHLFRDDNVTLIRMTVSTVPQRVYISYFCGYSLTFNENILCPLEVDTKNMFLNGIDEPNFLAIKVYNSELTLFVNSPKTLNQLPEIPVVKLKYNLGGMIVENYRVANFYVAKDLSGRSNYYGWIQDVRIFLIPLTNAELLDLHIKDSYYVFLQPECRCPNDFPRNENKYSMFCMTNENTTGSGDNNQMMRRINDNSHDIGFLNDNDLKTTWVSLISTNPISLELKLVNGIYILQRVEIYFSSLPPTSLKLETFYENRWRTIQTYSIECQQFELGCTQLPKVFGKEILGGYTIVWSVKSSSEKTEDQVQNDSDFFSRPELLEAFKATKFRLVMKGYYEILKNDIRQLYYSINEIKIIASCDCNGYSSTCDTMANPYQCQCDSESHTQGDSCQECAPLYNNKHYEMRYSNSSASCEACNCNNHASSCVYDELIDKGVCQNCSDNTYGEDCSQCSPNSYLTVDLKDSSNNHCESCICDPNGVKNATNICDQLTGECECKQHVDGTQCDRCRGGYFNFTAENELGCTQCDCNPIATIVLPDSNLTQCDVETGHCKCITNFVQGKQCDTCIDSMFNLELGCTQMCNCDPYGSLSPTCNKGNGQCDCKPHVGGYKCDVCEPGFYNLTSFGCKNECHCDPFGSFNHTSCDMMTGKCSCKEGYKGQNCDVCISGYWKSEGLCVKCDCNLNGVLNEYDICDQATGKCRCNAISEGYHCENCKLGYYGGVNSAYRYQSQQPCQKCDCDPKGSDPSSYKNGAFICDTKSSQCICKPNRVGLRCESCSVGWFLLDLGDIDCFQCNCDPIGSIPGSNCDKMTGECTCKIANGIGGTRCDVCRSGYYGFSRETGACSPCGCNLAGSLNQYCDSIRGTCNCKAFVTGEKCDVCIPGTSNLEYSNPFGCSKEPSKQSSPKLVVETAKSIQVSWTEPDYPNGIISRYVLYRNSTVVANTTAKSFKDTGVVPFTLYAYKIASYNGQGSTISRPSFVIIKLPSEPCCKFDFRISNIRSRSLAIRWIPPEKPNGYDLVYFIRIYFKIDENKPIKDENLLEQKNSTKAVPQSELILTNGAYDTSIDNLRPYSQYLITIRACNKDLVTSEYYCLNGTGIMDTNFKSIAYKENFLSFFTSQDRPEDQPKPTIRSINATYIILAIAKPLKPNGIVLLYQIWLRRLYENSLRVELVCSIEEFFDPNEGILLDTKNNAPKICIIRNLEPNTAYEVSASSSTIIGSSLLSPSLVLTTVEEIPRCPVEINKAYSNQPNSVIFNWSPSVNTSMDSYWQSTRCTTGNIKSFNIYKRKEGDVIFSLAYKGLKNEVEVGDLESTTVYFFRIEVCNTVGCKTTDQEIRILTLDAIPIDWSNILPKFEVINSTTIRFDWSDYVLAQDKKKNLSLTFRLERSNISFSYPPVPLESGVRFHGQNYFRFPAKDYFPEGYPYFGLKLRFRSRYESANFYYATSSFAQSEFVTLQFYQSKPWLVTNTQSNSPDCSIYLTPDDDVSYSDDKWHDLEALRLSNYAQIRIDDNPALKNSTKCTSNQVITDVQSVYIGGLPIELMNAKQNQGYKSVQNRRLKGCLKNASTVIEIESLNGDKNSYIREKKFSFDQAEQSAGESPGSNVYSGCPIEMETSNSAVQFLGYGYLVVDIIETLPIEYQSADFLLIDMDIRTEYSTGILYYDFVLFNFNYVLLRLVEGNQIEIQFKSICKYNDPLSGNPRDYSTLDLILNQTFPLGDEITNGHWFNLAVRFDFKEKNFEVRVNRTVKVRENLYTPLTIKKPTAFETIEEMNLLLDFYLQAKFYFGGYNYDQISLIITSLSRTNSGRVIVAYFRDVLEQMLWLNERLYFSGCMRNMRVNTYPLDFDNLNYLISYVNVRFDGCPSEKNLNLVDSEDRSSGYGDRPRIETIYEGIDIKSAFETSFHPFTEYFYRVVASNSQGKSASNWIIVRTPDAIPTEEINLKYLDAQAISGYQILVKNMTRFCYYCDSYNSIKNYQIFTGIVIRFVLHVNQFNGSSFLPHTNETFNCETVCLKNVRYTNKNTYIEAFKPDENPNAVQLTVNTNPVTKYELIVSICTITGCESSRSVYLKTLEEAPSGLIPPQLKERGSTWLSLIWPVPDRPNGNITGYILRKYGENSTESVLYFGLSNGYMVENLISHFEYEFSLEACNRIGCSRSDRTRFKTLEMIPISVSLPEVIDIDTNGIILRWSRPTTEQLVNGILREYILYVDRGNKSLSVIHIDNAATIQIVNGLTPGVDYTISLSACTGGGCRNSSALKVTTLESLPKVADMVLEAYERTSTYLALRWNEPKEPNGKIIKYSLYMNEHLVYEGLSTSFSIEDLLPSTYFSFYIITCNSFGCSRTNTSIFGTDEAPPQGNLILEANAAGSNLIQCKWYSDSTNPIIPNGDIMFSVYIKGPYLQKNLNSFQLVENIRTNKPSVIFLNLNLLNTSVMNTRYGILDEILPFNTYYVQVNASNSKGYLLSNQVQVATFKSIPEGIIPPFLIESTSNSMDIEWFDPVLPNSDDLIFYFQVEYRVKHLWTSSGPIQNASYAGSNITILYAKPTIARFYQLKNLRPYTAYSFRLTTKNSFGESKSDWSEDYLTQEAAPLDQSNPVLTDITFYSVNLIWKSPRVSNGLIRYYTLNIYQSETVTEEPLKLYKNFTMTTQEFTIKELEPFTYYIVSVESCNTKGCASSSLYAKDTVFFRTKPSMPGRFLNPKVQSINSYSIQINWQEPLKINGLIEYYILERMDLKPLLSEQDEFSSGNFTPKYRSYKFRSDYLMFIDFEFVEACSLYSYRMIAFNQVGSTHTDWVNVTVQPAKPVVQTPPLINIINSTVVRFEWIKPLTYCYVSKYILEFNNLDLNQTFVVDNIEENSIILNMFNSFQMYSVNLVACVSKLITNACTKSLSKEFMTPGAAPENVSIPVCRLISSKVISVEWLKPLFNNGRLAEYQLIRYTISNDPLTPNRSETIYIGQNNYFLDTDANDNTVYRYMVIYSNEFGNSFSDWSAEISTDLDIDNGDPKIIDQDGLKTVFIFCSLDLTCQSPTSGQLTWRTYETSELINYLEKLIEYDAFFENVLINRTMVMVTDLSTNTSRDLIVKDMDSNSMEISHLSPGTNYSVEYGIALSFGLRNVKTGKVTKEVFKFFSETKKCQTYSLSAAFGQPISIGNYMDQNNYLLVNYTLSGIILNSYSQLDISLNRTSFNNLSNSVELRRQSIVTNGQVIFGPLELNYGYEVFMTACEPKNNDCIVSRPVLYSLSTMAPRDISGIHFEVDNITQDSIHMNWRRPAEPNDFFITYQIYRRPACNGNLTHFSTDSKPCSTDPNKTVCCDGKAYPIKNGYECCGSNYLAKKTNMTCCGGSLHNIKPEYQCCAELYYIRVPPGQICCTSNTSLEISSTIGYGNTCCAHTPYYKDSRVQTCCETQVIPNKLQMTHPVFRYDFNTCIMPKPVPSETKCQPFQLVTMTSQLEYTDASLEPYTTYDYKVCANNTFGSACNQVVFRVETAMDLPRNFSYFEYSLVKTKFVFTWNTPIYANGPITAYKLLKNDELVYEGLDLYYVEFVSQLFPYKPYKYEVRACNVIGCVPNTNNLLISSREKLPDNFKPVTLNWYKNSVEINWVNPRLNGALKKYVLLVKEINIEIDIYFDFKSTQVSGTISAINLLKNQLVFSADSIFDPKTIYSLKITDLRPMFKYTFEIFCCNNFGCILGDASRFDTLSTQIAEFRDPIVFVRDKTSADIVWEDPKKINGNLMKFIIYRNNLFLKSLTSFVSTLGFYTYLDRGLVADKFYTYKIEAFNDDYSVSSNKVRVQTPAEDFITSCNYNNPMKESDAKKITLLQTLNIYFTVYNATEIRLTYSIEEWKQFISCVIDNNEGFQKNSTLSMRILLQSNGDGLQAIEFPYPDFYPPNSKQQVVYPMSGLYAYSNYSIRISLSTSYKKKQIFTSDPVLLKTSESAPCCHLAAPTISRELSRQQFSVRWKVVQFVNGPIQRFVVKRGKLRGQGCNRNLADNMGSLIENVFDVELIKENSLFFYDYTNMQYVYRDTNRSLIEDFAYYVYKVTLFNSVGGIESAWSEPILSWQFKPPSPPLDLKISGAHATGFKLVFKEPVEFNGILKYYTIQVIPFITYTRPGYKNNEKLILNATRTCKTTNATMAIEVEISGLYSFRSYKVSVTASSTDGLTSEDSEQIVANTLESSPSRIRPLIAEPKYEQIDESTVNNYIVFNFQDPQQPNGALAAFNLYQIVPPPLSFNLIYSGLRREFIHWNLKPFTEYSYIYELCTYAGCTRDNHVTKVKTLENPPMQQPTPEVIKYQSYLNCFKVSWSYPLKENGNILFFEVFRLEDGHSDHNEKLVMNYSTNLQEIDNLFYIDCELKPNVYYSYRVRSFNKQGHATSNYSRSLLSSQLLPEGFEPMFVMQLVNVSNVVLVEWSPPNLINGIFISYSLYRDSKLIKNITGTTAKTSESISFVDKLDFLPLVSYKYEVFACNEAGCATSENYTSTVTIRNQPPAAIGKAVMLDIAETNVSVDATASVLLLSSLQKVVEYQFFLDEKLIYSGPKASIKVLDLLPNTPYNLVIGACTYIITGCLVSNESLSFQTKQSNPENLMAIEFTDEPIDEYFLDLRLKWELPAKPNGVLDLVEIKRDDTIIYLSKNLDIVEFVDVRVNYGTYHRYRLTFYNEAGPGGVTSTHYTMENFPKVIEKPVCAKIGKARILLEWKAPVFPNGIILSTQVKFKTMEEAFWNTLDIPGKNLNLSIEDLVSYKTYQIQIGFCNNKGCSYSDERMCQTLEAVPMGLDKPTYTDTSDEYKLSLEIKWKPPLQPNGIIQGYRLIRRILEASIIYGIDYQVVNVEKNVSKAIYSGTGTEFKDFDLISGSKYDYMVEVLTKIGSTLSPWTRVDTQVLIPNSLVNMGNIKTITNEMVLLDLNPPLYLNGQILRVYIELISPQQIKEIQVYHFEGPVAGQEFLQLLKNIRIERLKSYFQYELKVYFCNAAGCLVSEDSLKFMTLDNDKLVSFDADIVSPSRVDFKWEFAFGDKKINRVIIYQIKIINQEKNDVIIYEGRGDQFSYEQLSSASTYLFQLEAKDISDNIMDKKYKEIRMPLDKPLYVESSRVNINVLNQTTAVTSFELDWKNSFLLNGALVEYSLFINKANVYRGMETRFTQNLATRDCELTEYYYEGQQVRGYFHVLYIQLFVLTIYSQGISPEIILPINCTRTTPEKPSTEKLEPLISSLIFILAVFLAIIITSMIISFICRNRTKKKRNAAGKKHAKECLSINNKEFDDRNRWEGSGSFNFSTADTEDELLYASRSSEAGGSSVRNKENKLKDFENAKLFKTISDYKKKQSNENLTSATMNTTTTTETTNRNKKKLRFLMDTIEETRF